MRYLITGGAGFIGSHVAEALIVRGDSVTVLDDLSTGQTSNVQHLLGGEWAGCVDLQVGSILDHQTVSELVGRADAIFHLAASVGVNLIIQKPLESLLNNVRGTEVVLEAAANAGVKTLIASTSEIYGKNSNSPLGEDADRILGSPFKSRWAYSTSKAVDEILAYAYFREVSLPTVVARLFNCAGPRQTGAFGMVLPRFVQQALDGDALTVFGDGTQTRSFCHVADTVEALVGLMDSDTVVGDVFNVGAPNEIAILSLAELVIALSGSASGTRFVPYSEAYEPGFEDMQRRVPDISKIKDAIGWTPVHTLDDVVNDTIEYESERRARTVGLGLPLSAKDDLRH